MQLTIGKQPLAIELGLLQGVVERKSTIPILTTALIETSEGMVTITATDFDVSIRCQLPAEVREPGAVVVHARNLFEIVRSLPEADITIETVAISPGSDLFEGEAPVDFVSLVSGTARFKMICNSKERFPSVPEPMGDPMALNSELFGASISRTIFAVTQEESRYALAGALFILQGSAFRLVTTDGHRLAIASGPLDVSVGEELRVLIPRKALNELRKLASATSGATVRFSKDENHLFFEFGSRSLTSRMLSGQFPSYEQVIPKNCDKVLSIDTAAIAPAVHRAALMTEARSHAIALQFGGGQLKLTAQAQGQGESVEMIPVDYSFEEESLLRFNSGFLLDFFNTVDSEGIVFAFKDGKTPAVLRPQDGQYQHEMVIMPMRI
ncbi:MAG TPA: DNA polymerase III subunit beta [Blastocatellia bacterium]|nr:DNA polymerase III subunit beta [Blastocatellia bacterium]